MFIDFKQILTVLLVWMRRIATLMCVLIFMPVFITGMALVVFGNMLIKELEKCWPEILPKSHGGKL